MSGVDPDGRYKTEFGARIANFFNRGNGVGYNSIKGEWYYSKGFSVANEAGITPVYDGAITRYTRAFSGNLGKDFHSNVTHNINSFIDHPLKAMDKLSYNILSSVTSLMYPQTYVDMYEGAKNYIQAPAEVKGMIDAQAINGAVENAVTLAPIVAIAPNLNGVGVNVRLYPNAKGVGMNVTKNGQRVVGLDWHEFKMGGKNTGTMVNRPHIDAPFSGMHHWPW